MLDMLEDFAERKSFLVPAKGGIVNAMTTSNPIERKQ